MRKWTDKEGNKRVSAEVVAENVYFGDSKREESNSNSGNSYGQRNGGGYTAPAYSAPAYSPAPRGSAFAELEDDDGDLPF